MGGGVYMHIPLVKGDLLLFCVFCEVVPEGSADRIP